MYYSIYKISRLYSAKRPCRGHFIDISAQYLDEFWSHTHVQMCIQSCTHTHTHTHTGDRWIPVMFEGLSACHCWGILLQWIWSSWYQCHFLIKAKWSIPPLPPTVVILNIIRTYSLCSCENSRIWRTIQYIVGKLLQFQIRSLALTKS